MNINGESFEKNNKFAVLINQINAKNRLHFRKTTDKLERGEKILVFQDAKNDLIIFILTEDVFPKFLKKILFFYSTFLVDFFRGVRSIPKKY